MDATSNSPSKHIGRKIGRIRELRGMKQETLATELGLSQQTVSRLEQSETIEEELLENVARVLGVTADAIKNYSDEAAINYFNTFYDNSTNNGAVYSFNSTFNPIESIVDLYNEKIKLLEQLLASEREKVELLKKNPK